MVLVRFFSSISVQVIETELRLTGHIFEVRMTAPLSLETLSNCLRSGTGLIGGGQFSK